MSTKRPKEEQGRVQAKFHDTENKPWGYYLRDSRGQPELEPDRPFSRLIAHFGSFEEGSAAVSIDPRFMSTGMILFFEKRGGLLPWVATWNRS